MTLMVTTQGKSTYTLASPKCKGISDYGNCIGVPTIGGELEFDNSLNNYCLVDVVCIGLGAAAEIIANRTSRT